MKQTLYRPIGGLALALAAVGLIAVGIAQAAGIYQGYTQYSTASQSLYNGSTTFASGVTPVITGGFTGNELFLMDTQAAAGASPETVAATAAQIGSGAAQYAVPLTGNTVNIANGANTLIIEPAGTLATLTVVLPVLPLDQQTVRVTSTQTLTALTVSATGGPSGVAIAGTAVSALTPSGTSSTGYEYMYLKNTNKWYRIQ